MKWIAAFLSFAATATGITAVVNSGYMPAIQDFFGYLIGMVTALVDPATCVDGAASFLGVLIDFAGTFFSTDALAPISSFLQGGALGDMIDLVFYFASPLVYVTFCRTMIGLVAWAWTIGIVLKCVMWVKAFFWSAPA